MKKSRYSDSGFTKSFFLVFKYYDKALLYINGHIDKMSW